MSNQQCGNCRFAAGFKHPGEAPIAKQHSMLWGLIKWEEDMSWERMLYSDRLHRHERIISCHLLPKTTAKYKSSWCSHWQPRSTKESD